MPHDQHDRVAELEAEVTRLRAALAQEREARAALEVAALEQSVVLAEAGARMAARVREIEARSVDSDGAGK